jgi:hypothetical protein
MSASISDRVNSVVEELQSDSGDPFRDRSMVELKYEVNGRGTVTEVYAVLTAGGPHIEVECLRGVVVGHWGGESFRRGIDSEDVTEFGRIEADRMEERID